MSTDPDRSLQHTTDELDDRLQKLEEQIGEAEEKAPNATLGEDDGGGVVAGDWSETDDASGGEDPEGAPVRDQHEER